MRFTIELRDVGGFVDSGNKCQDFLAEAATTIRGKQATIQIPFKSKISFGQINDELHGESSEDPAVYYGEGELPIY